MKNARKHIIEMFQFKSLNQKKAHMKITYKLNLFSYNSRQSVREASSLPSKYQVTCDLVGSKNLVAFKRRCENVLVAFTGSHFFSNS